MSAAEFSSVERDGGTVLIIRVGAPTTSKAREALLTASIHGVIDFLARCGHHRDEVVVIDLRIQDRVPDTALPGALAFIEGVRGIVQSYVLEMSGNGPATNLVISDESGARSRDRTIEYLFSSDGRFSRGASYDVRRDA